MKLQAPHGVSSASADGQSFDVDEQGFVEVPDELCIHLYQFGFVAHYEQESKKKPEQEVEVVEPEPVPAAEEPVPVPDEPTDDAVATPAQAQDKQQKKAK